MTPTFKPHLEILPPAQLKLWPELSFAPQLGFVLYGGTAIALRLGHRNSVDFDFFAEKPLDRDALKAAFPALARGRTLQDRPNAWTVLMPVETPEREHVKLSFFGTADFGRVGQPDLTEDGILQIASLDDLMATKVKVILQRIEAKDYRDIAAMVNAGVNLAHGLASARLLYGPNFQPSECLKALIYFEDGDLNTLTRAEKVSLMQAVKALGSLPEVAIRSRHLTFTP